MIEASVIICAHNPRPAYLARVLDGGTPAERAAATLALYSAPTAEARALLERHGALRDAVATGAVTWSSVLDAA